MIPLFETPTKHTSILETSTSGFKSVESAPDISFMQVKSAQIIMPNSNHTIARYNISTLLTAMHDGFYMKKQDLLELIKRFSIIIKYEPNLLRVTGNALIVGDLHGQYYDFEKIIAMMVGVHGSIQEFFTKQSLLFLGDYVDRGRLSIQILVIIMALKVNYPAHVFCLRGNHQSRAMTSAYNFKSEVLAVYDHSTYNRFIEMFQILPLACLINENYFCVHGGISASLSLVSDINSIQRGKQIPQQGLLCDLLWADPMPTIAQDHYLDTVYNNKRQCSVYFGKNIARKFSYDNKILAIIRAHQVYDEGYHRRQWGDGTNIITIFSAPNYCGNQGNLAAILHLKNNYLEVKQFKQQKVQKLPPPIDVFQLTLNEIVSTINKFSEAMIDTIFKICQDQCPEFQQTLQQERFSLLLAYLKYVPSKNKKLKTSKKLLPIQTIMKPFNKLP